MYFNNRYKILDFRKSIFMKFYYNDANINDAFKFTFGIKKYNHGYWSNKICIT
jgi:hypothetical protein